ncbi:hypothetical protein GHT41_04315 [Citrobacter koseri]|uniref:hypothetical protein n=1 Tax=Citrobacter koseri TaxID=545 RepID=UPI00190649D6|nr:hypothetical protein [Citrobacter koseri]MBJ9352893.1 hypothetical protein [Citrobacter koseri]
MTIDKWIALGACIAAFISAIAALMAVKQASRQRKLSYKPQVLFKPQYFTYQINNQTKDILDQVEFDDCKNPKSTKREIVVNIGLGAALNVNIEWSYQFDSAINLLNKYFSSLNYQMKMSSFANGIELYNSYSETKRMFLMNRNKDKLDYILSYNQNPNPTEVTIPYPALSLSCAIIIYSLKSESRIFKEAPKLTVKVKYNDIGGVFYTEEYLAKVDFSTIHEKENDSLVMYGSLSFEKNNTTNKTIRRLQSIRKSYADFMNEHDFNKNR